MSEAESNTSGPFNRVGIADLLFFEKTITYTPKVTRIKILESDRLCFISIGKCGKFKSPFAKFAGLSEIQFWFRYLPLRADEISDFSELFSKFSRGRRGTKIKDVLPCNIFQIIMKTIPMHATIVISCVMKRGINFWFWKRLNENWDNNMTITSQWRESYCRTITRARKINSK